MSFFSSTDLLKQENNDRQKQRRQQRELPIDYNINSRCFFSY